MSLIFLVAGFRDFAYVARDPATGKHKCHMFRCHGNISGRAITNALHDMCSKILEEKKKAQESTRKISAQKPWSDIINTPPPSSARGTLNTQLLSLAFFESLLPDHCDIPSGREGWEKKMLEIV